MTIEITRDVAAKVLEVVDAGLSNGLGNPKPGQMCVEAAVCYALGLPHGDNPACVSPALRALKIRLNDSGWSSKEARAKGLRRLAVAQLGSAGFLDESEFIRRVVDMTIRKVVAGAMRVAAKVHPIAEHKQAMLAAADRCEKEGTRETAQEARRVGRAAAADAAAAYAAAAADAAAAYAAAAYAADAAAAAAYAAAAADAYAAAAAKKAARDTSLATFAEDVVQILISMGAPGCQWLELTEAVS